MYNYSISMVELAFQMSAMRMSSPAFARRQHSCTICRQLGSDAS